MKTDEIKIAEEYQKFYPTSKKLVIIDYLNLLKPEATKTKLQKL